MNTCPWGRLFASEAAAATAKPGATVRPHGDHFHATHDLQAGQGLSRMPFRRAPAEPTQRAVTLQRAGRLRYRSPKTAAVYRDQRIPLTQAMLAERPWCEIRWDDGCTRRADALHELLSRGRGGSITDPENCVPACNHCNGAVSDNPVEAEARGFLKRSGRPSKAVPR